MAKLSAKRQRFAEEYLVDLNGKQAAIRAGYSPKTAEQISYQLLHNTSVHGFIARAMAERSRRTGFNQDRVVQELAKIAFLNVTDAVNMDAATMKGEAAREDTACIASVRVKVIPTGEGDITEREVKTYDKVKALALLGKHLGLFSDKVSIDGVVPVVISGGDELED